MPRIQRRSRGGRAVSRWWALRVPRLGIQIVSLHHFKNLIHLSPGSSRTLFLAWPTGIISQFTFFSTHFFQAIDPCGLLQPCWIFLPMNELPFTASRTVPCAISQTFLPFGSWSCLCYCFHYFKNGEEVFLLKLPNLVFTLLDSKVCCLGAGRWMRQKSHWFDFPFQFFRSFPACLVSFSLLTVHLNMRLFLPSWGNPFYCFYL